MPLLGSATVSATWLRSGRVIALIVSGVEDFRKWRMLFVIEFDEVGVSLDDDHDVKRVAPITRTQTVIALIAACPWRMQPSVP